MEQKIMRSTVSPGSGVKFRLLALFLLNEPGKAWNSIAYNTKKRQKFT